MRSQKTVVLLIACLFTANATSANVKRDTPFADNDGNLPTQQEYRGPLFKLSHDYPDSAPVPAMPWRTAIGNGLITVRNAPAYTQQLKQVVSADMITLLQNYQQWNAPQRGWYNEPWLGTIRESIHGTYVGGSSLDNSLFAASGLSKPITTYVLTYYDRTAAVTLKKVWGADALQPAVSTATTQYAEGAIIVKAAFVTADPTTWPVLAGTQMWPLYITIDATTGQLPKPQVVNTYLMQFDIIVKDSASAPDTGWVFSTLVYDKRIKPGRNGVWDQMVVLGASWGNDPEIDSTAKPAARLRQNWNNPAAPAYGGATFGWGGRLSGPNDGARNDISFNLKGKQQYIKNATNSSCMSCHSTAQ